MELLGLAKSRKKLRHLVVLGKVVFFQGFEAQFLLFQRHSQPESQSMQLITIGYITLNKLLGLPPRGKLICLLRFV